MEENTLGKACVNTVPLSSAIWPGPDHNPVSVPGLKALQSLSMDGRNIANARTHTPISERLTELPQHPGLQNFCRKKTELPLKKKPPPPQIHVLLDIRYCYPTFSILSLLKGFQKNMEVTTAPQHRAKRDNLPSWQSAWKEGILHRLEPQKSISNLALAVKECRR